MHIYIASDHNGFELKNTLREWLIAAGYEVTDMGPDQFNKDDDYPDFGLAAARAVAENPDDNLGVLICGSGVGMAVAAGKVAGIRAGLIHNPQIAKAARQDDDINVLALAAAYITPGEAKDILSAWLTAEFSGLERHTRRIGKISAYEQAHTC